MQPTEHCAWNSWYLGCALREVLPEVPSQISFSTLEYPGETQGQICVPDDSGEEAYLCTNVCDRAAEVLFWDRRDRNHIVKIMRFSHKV